MTETEQKKLIYTLLGKCRIGVLSTIHEDGAPQAAVVGVSERDGYELVFDTFPDSRKYKNLKADPRVAMVIGWENDITIQYEGVAEEVSAADKADYLRTHIAKIPHEKTYVEMGAVPFRIRPTWLRYCDYSVDPPLRFELAF